MESQGLKLVRYFIWRPLLLWINLYDYQKLFNNSHYCFGKKLLFKKCFVSDNDLKPNR